MMKRPLSHVFLYGALLSGMRASTPIPEMSASTVYVFVPISVVVPSAGKRATLKGSGSGFLVGDGRHVITNYHVCCQPKKSVTVQDREIPLLEVERHVEVQLDSSTRIAARVLWSSPDKDLAVLELERDSGRKPVTLVSADLVKEGEKVYAIGFPGDADQVRDESTKFHPTITDGIISAKLQPNEKYGVGSGSRLYQTSAPINPGNSGGPLFDACGRVIGINDATAAHSQGIHFAIVADEVMMQLRAMGIQNSVATTACSADEPKSAMSGLSIVLQTATAMAAIAALALAATRRGREAVRQTTNRIKQTPPVQAQGPAGVAPPLRLPPRQPLLKGISGYHAGATIRLDGLELAIGRDARFCQLVYPPDMDKISKRHCVLSYDAGRGRVLLADAGSRNGTFVGGRRVDAGKQVELPPRSQFYLADSENTFEISEG